MDSTPIFSGPIAAFRRELLDDLKLTTIADDTELCLKIREKGFKAIYDPEAIAYEFYPTKTKSRMKQKIRRGQGIIQSFMWHRRILFNSKYGKYGLVIFPCEFFMHIISPILFSLIIISATIIVFNNPAILTRFGLVAILLLVLFGLILLAQSTLRIRKTMINPITVVATFLDHQIFLLLSLFSLLLRRNVYKWEKIEEVRTFCTVNN